MDISLLQCTLSKGDNFPVYDDMRKYVIDKGLGAGDGSNVGTVLYSRGMYAAIVLWKPLKLLKKFME